MDELNTKKLLGQAPVTGDRPAADCPDEQILTAALNGEYRAIEQTEFEKHVSSCNHCLARLGRVARLRRDQVYPEIPELTLARARKMIRSQPATGRAPAWAAAAMIGFAALLTTLWHEGWDEPSDPATAPSAEVRNIDGEAFRPKILFPREGERLNLRDPHFEWTAVPGSMHYDVRIVRADGTVVWQERVQNASWRLPEHLRLAAGEDYFFRVDAYVTRAKRLSSRHVMFAVENDG